MYECASVINEETTIKEGDYIPRILNWRIVGVKPKFENMFSIFTKVMIIFISFKLQLFLACWVSKVVLECMYKYTTYSWRIDFTLFSGQSGCSHFEHSMSADKSKQAILDDIPGFGN